MKVIEQYSMFNHYDYNKPKFLVLHYVGAQSSTAKNNADYFGTGDRQASAHEFIDDNYCYKVIKENNGAWHVGNTRTEVNNQNSIGIEMCCMANNLGITSKTEENALERVVYYMKKYNIPIENLKTHYIVSGDMKICPNWTYNNWSRWIEFKKKVAAKLNNSGNVNVPTNNQDIVYRVKLANGEQIGAFKTLEYAKNLAKINKCNVHKSTDNSIIESYLPTYSVASKTINYRVKRENGQQLGAYNSLDNANNLAKKEKAIIYDIKGQVVKSYVPAKGLGYVNLKPHVNSWRVYAVDGPYTTQYAVATLSPAKYNGLSYEILGEKMANVYKIKTSNFGVVAIYVPKDGDSTFTNSPTYK